ncbi:MAG: hypothetical protein ACE14P_03635 [Methanotrichaceae archaeon]
MDVSYSAWRQSADEKLMLDGDNFSFLFDRRYTNRLNRMSKVFFEAYARATKELASQEDRFPSLSEIDARMESGSVYAFKDRLIKNTVFFEEVKISWVTYLVPRAKTFIDGSGTYTELAFNFDDGTVMLPTRRKAPEHMETTLPEPEKSDQQDEDFVEAETEAPSQIDILPDPQKDTAHPLIVPKLPENATGEIVQGITGMEKDNSIGSSVTGTNAQKLMGIVGDSRGKIKIAVLGLAALIILAMALNGFDFKVNYSFLLSDTSQGNILDLNITNRDGFDDEIEIVLPPNIYRSIISRGGVITIFSDNITSIRLDTNSDASVRLYLSNNWTVVPVTLSLKVPKGQGSELKFIRGDYSVKNMDDRITLRFNCTREGFIFEQRMKRWFWWF